MTSDHQIFGLDPSTIVGIGFTCIVLFGGFLFRLQARVSKLEDKMSVVEKSVSHLEGRLDNTVTKVNDHHTSIELLKQSISTVMTVMKDGFERVEGKLDSIAKR